MTREEQLIALYARRMPPRIRRYLNERAIPDGVIERFQLGWNGCRITIPVFNQDGEFAFFRLARDPDASSPQPKMLSTPGSSVELYGWERVLEQPREIVICEGEFDRLVLEAHGIAAVSSTGGAGTFRPSWAQHFADIPYVFIAYDLDEAGRLGERNVARMIPHARAVRLPARLGTGGDVTDFFVSGGTAREFRGLLDRAQPVDTGKESCSSIIPQRPFADSPASPDAVALVKSRTSLEWLASHYVTLHRSGNNFIGRCPFHPDRTPSFVVFPETRSYHCFGCKCSGDCISFLMRAENLSFPEALTVLRQLAA